MKTNIVVLDGHTLNPGDLSWEGLHELGDCTVYDFTSPEDVINRCQRADAVILNKTPLTAKIIARLPKLKYIGVLATGYNNIDVKAARERDIPVCNIPNYGAVSVAQMTFAHLLNLTQRVELHAQTVCDGKWSRSRDFCYWESPLVELAGLTIGLIGMGTIGREVAKRALAFDMKVLAFDPFADYKTFPGITFVDLEKLLTSSDVVSLHCPLSPKSENLIDERALSLMKRSAFLINTSRGPLVDGAALADALNAEEIAGAGLDVLPVEPPPENHPLYNARNCFITPHISWATLQARSRLMDMAVENVAAFLSGNPVNVVN